MSKRRLSKQQQTRIAKNQHGQFAGDTPVESGKSGAGIEQCNGRVISHFGKQLDVESFDSDTQGQVVRCHQRANLPRLVTGDYVLWEYDREGDGESDQDRLKARTGVILALGERSSIFARPTSQHTLKPIAANIDLVMVVIAPLPEPFMNLIDRYLVAVACLGLEPMLVMNKTDLSTNDSKSELDNMLSLYETIGYEIHRVSAVDGAGVDRLEQSLKGKTAVLVGQSGVGKSSLINRLGPDIDAEVGPLSAAKAKGTHTTTTSTLFHLDSYDLVDSPGIREFSLGNIDQHQLFDGFPELRKLAGKCKFRDCSHRVEPGCVIQAAVDSGQIFPQRLDSYFQILQTLSWEQ